jgi:O-antigen chain-terminating methyltransferase
MSGKSSSIDVAEVLDQLRESVRQQQPSGAISSGTEPDQWRRWELLFDRVERAKEVNPHLPIAWPEWPRGLVPKAVAAVQKVVRRLLRWYINPLVEQQNVYNEGVTEALVELIAQIKLGVEQRNRLDDEIRATLTRTGVLNQRMRRLEERPGSGPAPMGEYTDGGGATPVPAGDGGLDYFMLELKHRGSPEFVKERQAVYLPYLAGRRAVLDIGCGRGEFVELLRENGVEARGIDLDPDAVIYCQERGLPVEQAEATAYLRRLDDGALDGVYMAQVAEHLTPTVLQTLLRLAFRKLEPGGIVVIETVNPLCVYALVNHYLIDPSHVRPLHPELLSFMVESVGFGQAKIRHLSPTPDDIRLHHHPTPAGSSVADQERITLMNQNVERVNHLLFGYQDYAVLATRPPRVPSLEELAEGDDG